MCLRQCAESADCSNALIAWRQAPRCKTANGTHFRARNSVQLICRFVSSECLERGWLLQQVWKSWWKEFVSVKSLLPCDLSRRLLFSSFHFCLFFWRELFPFLGENIPFFHELASDIERRHAPRPCMDDDALNTSEYYSDAQSFRALRKRIEKWFSCWLRRKLQQKYSRWILPVILESKSGKLLKTYIPVYIHKCLNVYGFVQSLFSVE